MRPINKGPQPIDIHGNPINPTDYKEWRKALIDRIGYYCVYCNQPLSHSLQVEHVIPKSPPAGYKPGDPIAWNNMLLACGPCNNAKGNTPINSTTYYLPEEHNTHLPFKIAVLSGNEHAIVSERAGILPNQITKAQSTISLLELANVDKRDAIVDIRSMRRRDAEAAVIAYKLQYDLAKQSPTFIEAIAAVGVAKQAKVTGFFSLWYEAFSNEVEVMRRLVDNTTIKGTAVNCFDAANNFIPVPRNPLNVADPF